MLVSWSHFLFNIIFSFDKRTKSHIAKSGMQAWCGTRVAQTKHSEQVHCPHGETNRHNSTSQVILTQFFADDVWCLCTNAGLQLVPMEQIHNT
jgi:hypothetical protein